MLFGYAVPSFCLLIYLVLGGSGVIGLVIGVFWSTFHTKEMCSYCRKTTTSCKEIIETILFFLTKQLNYSFSSITINLLIS